MRKRASGYSLLEVVISAALFSIFLTIGSDMLIFALRGTSQGEERQLGLDELRDFTYRFSLEFRDATALLDPPFSAMVNGSSYIVFQTNTEGIIKYSLVQNGQGTKLVQRQLYLTYTPGGGGITSGGPRNMTSSASTLLFTVGTGIPPGHGGTSTGPGTGLALGQSKNTIQIQVSETPPDVPTPMTVLTKKTLFAGIFPGP